MKTNDKNRAVIAESIARAWKDESFKNDLVNNPKATLEAAGASIDAGHDVVVVENTDTVVHAVLPLQSEQAQHSDQIDAGLEELRNLSDGVEVRVHRDTASKSHVALPQAPAAAQQLSDADLEQVAGGKGSHNAATQGTVVQTGASVTTTLVETEIEVGTAVAVVVVPCFIS